MLKNTLEQQKVEVQQNVQCVYFDANANYENYLAVFEAENQTISIKSPRKVMKLVPTIYDLNNARNNYINAQGSVSQDRKYNFIFSTKLLNFYAGIPLSL